MNTDYADDIAFLTNTTTQAESLLHSLDQIPWGIGRHVNANKTEFILFTQPLRSGRIWHKVNF